MEQMHTAKEWADMYRHMVETPHSQLIAEGVIDVETLYAATHPTVAVVLTDNGERRIQVIRVIREFTGLGLIPAKEFTDNVRQGEEAVLMVTRDHGAANRFGRALRIAGATVYVRSGDA